MANEPIFGWPLPDDSDPPALPTQLASFADGVAATIVDERPTQLIQTGTVTLQFNNTVRVNTVVTFPTAFSATPVVVVSSVDDDSASYLGSSALQRSATQVTVELRSVTDTPITDTRYLSWVAVGPA